MRGSTVDESRVTELLAPRQIFHSENQRRWAIVHGNSYGGSLYGQLRQALRELAHRRNLIALGELSDREAALNMADIEEQLNAADTEEDRDNPRVQAERERLEIKLERMRIHAAEQIPRRQALQEEYRHFYEIADSLDKQLGGLTPEKREALDSQMWFDWVREQIALDLLTNGTLQRATISRIVNSPPERRVELLDVARDVHLIVDNTGRRMRCPGPKQEALIEWYTGRDLPALIASDDIAIRHRQSEEAT